MTLTEKPIENLWIRLLQKATMALNHQLYDQLYSCKKGTQLPVDIRDAINAQNCPVHIQTFALAVFEVFKSIYISYLMIKPYR